MGSEIIVVPAIFLGMPWIIFHYITKWKTAPKITEEDEKLLDEMHLLARRLEDRLNTIERIVAADNPDFKPTLPSYDAPPYGQAPRYELPRRN
ncbi:phage shock protein B [Sphingomonas sp. Leaf17]|uniref:envelope stress response membrane protein PspB n=1 Tax=Sphingomonas sp. Leaf17 TaxID=1735683 RepID=UPI0006FB314A|nr:envelope stress response membrane protein PspB [Sphingomonas sp. Leaf17]KQM65673.1 phage shock protein B [Sphingomonas sp. Leaf17]